MKYAMSGNPVFEITIEKVIGWMIGTKLEQKMPRNIYISRDLHGTGEMGIRRTRMIDTPTGEFPAES